MVESRLIEEIARRVLETLNAGAVDIGSSEIPVGISVRHIHIAPSDLEVLYGKRELTKLRDLYQEGEFAAQEVVALVGPKMRALENVRILGPSRERTQVEVSWTDAIYLGLTPPVRPSGRLDGSASITLVGPAGTLFLPEAVIVANRHIHMSPTDAAQYGVRDGDYVTVDVCGEKGLVFKHVQVRVKDSFRLQMHLDTDDANAAGISCGAKARILERE